ncbi:MAG: potassium-transporting ATPase subunit KdpC [Kineosporiaceae bacterium]|nr:potassium-transporting ATPase subunit KdpC [Kineosporiaceae bacterium]MBK8077670.1 potassium-transporting ATPase subunit KdpC [Kineosporiaceae bacterium]
MITVRQLARLSLAGLRLLLVFTVVLGLAYPLAMVGLARLVPGRADGSLISSAGADGQVIGSRLIGQPFTGDGWFLPRPSVAGDGYDPMASGASNLGPNNADLAATIHDRIAQVAAREGVDVAAVPPDAVTASASGLDPDISPQYARLQVARVARARDLPVADVAALVEQHVRGRQLGFIGEPRVNVLELNLALDALRPAAG